MYTNILIFAAGIYLVLVSMLMSTKNLQSLILFKAIPFALGLANILIAVKIFGWFG
jgi:hypothetical protein